MPGVSVDYSDLPELESNWEDYYSVNIPSPIDISDIVPVGGSPIDISDIVPVGGPLIDISGIPVGGPPIDISDIVPVGGSPIDISNIVPISGTMVGGDLLIDIIEWLSMSTYDDVLR